MGKLKIRIDTFKNKKGHKKADKKASRKIVPLSKNVRKKKGRA